jgi:uncharacterized protein YebE (UPF0316 family)
MPSLLGSLVPGDLTLPLLVFTAELCVVTISTVRIIFVTRGMKLLAPLLGIFEITIWLFAIGQIMQNLDNLSCYLAFAGGFTLGNFFGVVIEKRLAVGCVVVHIITPRDADGLVEALRRCDFGVTRMDGRGVTGPVQIIFTVIKRKELERVTALIQDFDPGAFYSVNELRAVAAGVSPATRGRLEGVIPVPLWPFRSTA